MILFLCMYVLQMASITYAISWPDGNHLQIDHPTFFADLLYEHPKFLK